MTDAQKVQALLQALLQKGPSDELLKEREKASKEFEKVQKELAEVQERVKVARQKYNELDKKVKDAENSSVDVTRALSQVANKLDVDVTQFGIEKVIPKVRTSSGGSGTRGLSHNGIQVSVNGKVSTQKLSNTIYNNSKGCDGSGTNGSLTNAEFDELLKANGFEGGLYKSDAWKITLKNGRVLEGVKIDLTEKPVLEVPVAEENLVLEETV